VQAKNVFTRGEFQNMLAPALLATTGDTAGAEQRAALMQAMRDLLGSPDSR
jgi:hypothetical protein